MGDEQVMAEPERFTAYKGYRLYYPASGDFSKDHNGRYTVVVLVSKDGERHMHRIPIPFAYGWTAEDALAESLQHGKRLVDLGLIPDAPAADDAAG